MIFVYRNREDDKRGPDKLHFCAACGGWYGVPHTNSHCQTGTPALFPQNCACRFCKEETNQRIEGTWGFWTGIKEWQP
jgi:hypothetical protein